ncbi:MAG: hypothetical protein O2971_13185 [Proteobacteria bacterium]|nr:hypothetical protein [Pseudomonadota bacterium]
MEIIFREMPHTYDEVVMGHKLWFPDSIESDVISATANIDGFTPLTAISRRYGWSNDLLTSASAQCNSRNEIAVIKELSPTLLLVPSTKGRGNTDFLIKDLIKAANAVTADVLNFTHFGFIQNRLQNTEIQSILDVLLDEKLQSSIRVIIWDIDFRFKKEMKQMWKLKISSL